MKWMGKILNTWKNEVDECDVEDHSDNKEMRLIDVEELIDDMNEQDNVDIDTIGESRIS